METIGSCRIVYGQDVETLLFDWGEIRLLCEPAITGGRTMTFGSVIVNPGTGHARHKHDGADEVIFVIEGKAEQMLDDRRPAPIRAGASVYIPRGVFHSTRNTGSEPLRLIVVYAPAGEEDVLRALPDVILRPPESVAAPPSTRAHDDI